MIEQMNLQWLPPPKKKKIKGEVIGVPAKPVDSQHGLYVICDDVNSRKP